MKSFELAAAESVGASPDAMPFTVAGDDTQLYAYPPSEGQMVLLLGLAGVDAVDVEKGAGAAADLMAVFWECLDEDSAVHLRRRMLSRDDAFGLGDVMNIIEWLIEEAGARPTTRSSGSTSSPGTTGKRSTGTARPKASTRSPSRRTASAT